MYDVLYVDGDSYTTQGLFVDVKDSYWHLMREHIGATEFVNFAQPGKSNEAMNRNVGRFRLQNRHKKVFYLIGYTHVPRISYFDNTRPNKLNKSNPAEQFFYDSHCYELNPAFARMFHLEGEILNFSVETLYFYNFLMREGVDFMMHNCALPVTLDVDTPYSRDFSLELNKCDRLVNLSGNTMLSMCEERGIKPVDYDKYKWVGHQGAAGNRLYYEYLKGEYDKLYRP